MYAIVDCNSFYCSCERVFRPDLKERGIVVLSNNDGCVISRTEEAKKAGIGMAVPYYQCREQLEKAGITVFSSNYYLYGDMSRRVMDTLRVIANDSNEDRVEVYSVDEAFIELSHIPPENLNDYAIHLKNTVEQWTGVRVSVGVGPSRVLSKMANRLAKKRPGITNGVLVLQSDQQIREALEETEVSDIWGIGYRYAVKLRDEFGIRSAWQLKHIPLEWARKNLGGVVGVRLIKELCGETMREKKDPLEKKKMIATTRMFGAPVYTLEPLREAIATYTARAAEKLRRQYSAASSLDVFVVTNGSKGKPYQYQPGTDHRYFNLPRPSSVTHELIAHAMPLVTSLYREGVKYLKAGVILGGIVPDNSVQADLFSAEQQKNKTALMDVMDNLNFSMRGDVIRYGATGTTRHWTMRQDKRSPRYTTRWEELFEVGKGKVD